jgi:hypothetical protein
VTSLYIDVPNLDGLSVFNMVAVNSMLKYLRIRFDKKGLLKKLDYEYMEAAFTMNGRIKLVSICE